MKCNKCSRNIQEKDIYEFKDKQLCDDCFIDLILGVPDQDISKLPPEVQAGFHNIMKGWHRDRPNRHHYIKYDIKGKKE